MSTWRATTRSQDATLRAILQQQGGDVFRDIAAALQSAGNGAGGPHYNHARGGQRQQHQHQQHHQQQHQQQVSPEERERAKRVTYGECDSVRVARVPVVWSTADCCQQASLCSQCAAPACCHGAPGIIYGLSAFGLAQQLADQGVGPAAAQGLIDSFLARFPGARARARTCVHAVGTTHARVAADSAQHS
jgi:hypothetical protein